MWKVLAQVSQGLVVCRNTLLPSLGVMIVTFPRTGNGSFYLEMFPPLHQLEHAMALGYTAGPLHKIGTIDRPAGAISLEGVPPFFQALIKSPSNNSISEIRLNRSKPTDVLSWLHDINNKYRDRLTENIFWNENSTFMRSEDVSVRLDLLLRYTAAVFDYESEEQAARLLLVTGIPDDSIVEDTLEKSYQRKNFYRFPQVLSGIDYWLPFKSDLIIDEPNWRGTLVRVGSVYGLFDELHTIQQFISRADPSVAAMPASVPQQQVRHPLQAAWLVSRLMSRIATAAISQRLPLYESGR